MQQFRIFYALPLELAIKLPGWSASSVIFPALAFSPISNFSFENKIVGNVSSSFTPAKDLNGTVIRIHNSIYLDHIHACNRVYIGVNPSKFYGTCTLFLHLYPNKSPHPKAIFTYDIFSSNL